MPKKTSTISKKNKAWREFSRFIRLRDCLLTTMDTDNGVCITCGKLIPFKSSQAGHFIAGRTNAVLFDEDIVHLQCYSCNVCNHGEQLEFYYALKKLGYTEDELIKMRQQRYVTKKYTAEDYEQIAQQYKDKADRLSSCQPFQARKLALLPHNYMEHTK